MASPTILVLGAPTPFGTHARLMGAILSAIAARGWQARIQVAPPQPERLPPFDGCIAAAYTAAIADALARSDRPVVNVDGAIDIAALPRVGTDPALVSAAAVRHLLQASPAAAAFLGNRDRADSRALGSAFSAGMQAAGRPTRVLALAGGWRTLHERPNECAISDTRLRRWLEDLPHPCALLAWSEDAALHLVDLAGRRRIGHDLLLVSATDACELLSPAGISGIPRDVDGLAAAAVALLAEQLATGRRASGVRYVSPLALVQRTSSTPALAADPAIARALALLGSRLAQPPRLRELCAAAQLPERTFRRRFSAVVGRPPSEELGRLRRERARALLAAGLKPADAARRCGFAGADQLARALRGRD